MAALTGNRSTQQYATQAIPVKAPGIPIADNVHIYQGALVQYDGAGRAVPAGVAAQVDTHTFRTVGRACREYDNTVAGHAAGALTVECEYGAFPWDNSGTDPVAQADVGNTVYAADDHTIAKTSNTNVLASAGKLIGLLTIPGFANAQAVVLTVPGIV
jgi:hypothetical protein